MRKGVLVRLLAIAGLAVLLILVAYHNRQNPRPPKDIPPEIAQLLKPREFSVSLELWDAMGSYLSAEKTIQETETEYRTTKNLRHKKELGRQLRNLKVQAEKLLEDMWEIAGRQPEGMLPPQIQDFLKMHPPHPDLDIIDNPVNKRSKEV